MQNIDLARWLGQLLWVQQLSLHMKSAVDNDNYYYFIKCKRAAGTVHCNKTYRYVARGDNVGSGRCVTHGWRHCRPILPTSNMFSCIIIEPAHDIMTNILYCLLFAAGRQCLAVWCHPESEAYVSVCCVL